jgi:hypothetical protein
MHVQFQIHMIEVLALLLFISIFLSVNKSTANGTKYARQIFKEAMILTFD